MDIHTQKLAKLVASGLLFSLETKQKMLQHLLDGKPPCYVEAELDSLHGNVFIGFKPAPDVNLQQYVTGGAFVLPREEFPTDEKAVQYIKALQQLRSAANFSQTLLKFFVERKTPWVSGVCEIVWYSYFTDEVSLRHIDDPNAAYVIISRKELLDGPLNIKGGEQPPGV